MADAATIAAAQPPHAGRLNLDHVAHFVPDIEAAAAGFAQLGFALTPFSAQQQRGADGRLAPAGAGNRCVMLERGYLECLTPTADTPIGRQLHDAIARYTGLHLIAFGTADAAADHARLAREGFAPLAPVDLQRPIGTENGEGTARFSVVRVPPGAMAEGRIQFCHQHTPQYLWQARWLGHANRAVALRAVIVCVADAADAAQRYARFSGIAATAAGAGHALDTERGRLLFVTPAAVRGAFGIEPPALPWIAGTVLATADLAATRRHLAAAGLAPQPLGRDRLWLATPPAVGGLMVFETVDSAAFVLPA